MEKGEVLGGYWLGPSSFAIQYWEVYILVNEKSDTVANLWDGVEVHFQKVC